MHERVDDRRGRIEQARMECIDRRGGSSAVAIPFGRCSKRE